MGRDRTAPTRAAGAAHSKPEARVKPSQLEVDYGACQGLKSSFPGVWPRREWAGLPVRYPVQEPRALRCALFGRWNLRLLAGAAASFPATIAAQCAQASRLGEQPWSILLL